jgi:hypothetical protein
MSRAGRDPRRVLLVMLCLVATLGTAARAADTDADEDLLEFLGGVGGEDAEFTDYLSKTDIAQAAKTAPKPAPAAPTEVNKS